MSTTPDDYAPHLRALGRAGLPYFMEGGQAVNALAEFFSEEVPALRKFHPYNSKDCDIWVGKDTLDQIERVLDGELHKAADPSEVQLGIFQFARQPQRLELFGHVHGITLNELEKVVGRVLVFDDISVMDPVYLFKAKCHNLTDLSQHGRQDRRHVEMLRLIVPAYFRHLIDRCKQGEITERAVIKDIKLFREFGRDQAVRSVLVTIGATLDSMVPISALKASGLPTLQAFAEGEWGARRKPKGDSTPGLS